MAKKLLERVLVVIKVLLVVMTAVLVVNKGLCLDPAGGGSFSLGGGPKPGYMACECIIPDSPGANQPLLVVVKVSVRASTIWKRRRC